MRGNINLVSLPAVNDLKKARRLSLIQEKNIKNSHSQTQRHLSSHSTNDKKKNNTEYHANKDKINLKIMLSCQVGKNIYI